MTALAEALETIAGPDVEAIGVQPSGRMRVASGQHRIASGQHRVASGQHRALTTPSSSQNSAGPTDRTTASGRGVRPAVIALVVLGVVGAGGLYLALRRSADDGGARGSANVPAPLDDSGSASAPGSDSAGASAGNAGSWNGPSGGATDASASSRTPNATASGSAPPPNGSGKNAVAAKGPAAGGEKTTLRGETSARSTRPSTATEPKPKTVADVEDLGEPPPPEEDDPTKNGPGMRPKISAPASSTITLKDVSRAIQRRDGKACRAALAKLTDPPPSDFRVASAHAVCEMVAGNCEGGKREERALKLREGSNPDSVEITAELYCSVNDPDPAVRLRRLSRQLSMFSWFECSYYLPAARASGKVVANDRERMQVGSALSTIAKCYSDRGDCPTARSVLVEAQAFIPAVGLSELNAACR